MNNEDTIEMARRNYDKHPKLAFSLILDVLEQQERSIQKLQKLEEHKTLKEYKNQKSIEQTSEI